MNRILAIIVLYNPNIDHFLSLLDIVKDEVDYVWVSDNSNKPLSLSNYSNVYYHFMNGNKGIAAAQNEGLKFALQKSYDQVIFYDQDSSFPKGFISELRSDFDNLMKHDNKALGIGPLAINRDSNVYLGKKRSIIKECCFDGTSYLMMSEFLSSSTIMKTEVFKNVGLMKDELFIDCVDYEIIWRAQYELGAHFYRSTKCKMYHQLGEGDVKVLGRNTHVPAPFRVYFEIRNVIILSKIRYVPIKWKFYELPKAFIKMMLYPVIFTPRLSFLRFSFLGFCDGFRFLVNNRIKNSIIKLNEDD